MSMIGKTVVRIKPTWIGYVIISEKYEVIDEDHGSVKLRSVHYGNGRRRIAGWFSATRVRVVEENRKGD